MRLVSLIAALAVAAILVVADEARVPALILGLLAACGIVFAAFLVFRRRATPPRPWIVIDGSNVMHWRENTPDIAPVKAVVADTIDKGYSPGVVFDANAGYKLVGRFQNDRELARSLGLSGKHVFVVPRGTPADPYILSIARQLNARVITNDRYRDWAEEYPEVTRTGYLIRGGWHHGRFHLDDETGTGQARRLRG